jgi:leucyl aminopeptidase
MANLLPELLARTSPQRVDADLVTVAQDAAGKAVAPKGAYSGLLPRLSKTEAFAGKGNQLQHVRFGGKRGAENVLLVGLGKAGELTEEKARTAGGHAYAKLQAEKARVVRVDADAIVQAAQLKTGAAVAAPARLIRAFAEGLTLPAYRFNKYQTGASKKDDGYFGPTKFFFVSKDKALQAELKTHLDQVAVMGECVTLCRDWSNEPSNYGTPEYYAGEVSRIAKQHGLKATVMDEKECEKQGMGLFLGVGQGSEREGRMVVVEYSPKVAKGGPAPKTLAFVGKGITFDTGGISLKPGLRMEEMKHDMTGAATMFAATLLAARWKSPNRVVCVMAFTENMPSGRATTPSSVHTGRSGKTVEIWNTDAEGRLILADALDLAHDYKPDVIIDAATLTGAVSVALGKYCCGVLGNDDGLVASLKATGDANGERMWQLPLYDEYFDDLRSDVADMKNVANDGNGGTIRGAIFLKQFIRKGMKWAHLDIAATANGISHLSYMPKKGASGLHVRTLAQFASEF